LFVEKGGKLYSTNITITVKAPDSGDVVQLYWIAGSAQNENSFVAYYTDTPPNPAFNAANYDSWSGANALV